MKKKVILLITAPTFKKEWIRELKVKFKKIKLISVNENKKEILSNIKKCTAMIGCPRYVFKEQNYENFKHLDWIHAGGAGIEDYISIKFQQSTTIFTNGKIIQGPEVADHAVGLILSFTRNLYYFAKNRKHFLRPIELNNKKVLIIGLGGIGICLAERLAAFGAKVDAFTNDMPPMLSILENIYYGAELHNIIKIYDVVACTAPLTEKTYQILNYNFFNRMKKGSIFINVSRGKIVKTEDLIKNNIYKKFRGIGLDVTDPEPLDKKNKLNLAHNVFITPHVAGPSDNNRERGYNLIKINIERYIKNKSLVNVVDKLKEY